VYPAPSFITEGSPGTPRAAAMVSVAGYAVAVEATRKRSFAGRNTDCRFRPTADAVSMMYATFSYVEKGCAAFFGIRTGAP